MIETAAIRSEPVLRRVQRDIPILKEGMLQSVLVARWESGSRVEAAEKLNLGRVAYNNYLRGANLALGTRTTEQAILAGMQTGIINVPEKNEHAPTLHLSQGRFQVVSDLVNSGASIEELAERHNLTVIQVKRVITEAASLAGIETGPVSSRDFRFNLFRWAHQNHIALSPHKRSFLKVPTQEQKMSNPAAKAIAYRDSDIELVTQAARQSSVEIANQRGVSSNTAASYIKDARRRLRSAELDTSLIDKGDLTLLLASGMSTDEIAEKFGTSSVVVARAIINAGINRHAVNAINKPERPPRPPRERKKAPKQEKQARPLRKRKGNIYTSPTLVIDKLVFDEILAEESIPEPEDPLIPKIELVQEEPKYDDLPPDFLEEHLTEDELVLFDLMRRETGTNAPIEETSHIARLFGHSPLEPIRLRAKLRKLRELIIVGD